MSNHLRQLIEDQQAGRLVVGKYVEQVAAEKAGLAMRKYGAQAMCFYVEGSTLNGRKPIDELVRLPYSIVWMEFEDDDPCGTGETVRSGWLCSDGTSRDGIARITAWMFVQGSLGRWGSVGAVRIFPMYQGGTAYQPYGAMHETISQALGAGVQDLCNALCLLNCSNIITRRHDPDQKLQKARAIRGKKPLFSYHTLEIDPHASREAGVDQGGTHASPRVHLRRGHIRKFAPGKWCWVRETIVRGITPGMVHKDYAMKGAVH